MILHCAHTWCLVQTSQPSRFWRKIPAFSLLLRHYDFLPNYPAKLTFPLPYIHCSISPWYRYTQYDRNLQLRHSVCIALMYERCTCASAMHAIYAHTYTPRPQISTLSCVYRARDQWPRWSTTQFYQAASCHQAHVHTAKSPRILWEFMPSLCCLLDIYRLDFHGSNFGLKTVFWMSAIVILCLS